MDSLMLVSSGHLFDVDEAAPAAFDMAVVGHALAHICRYGGHTSRFYSVAEHCVLLAEYFELRAKPGLAKWALVHDAPEAFVGDVIRPLKRRLPAFVAAEDKLAASLFARLGLMGDMPAEVEAADSRILADEVAMFFPKTRDWSPVGPPLGVSPHGLPPQAARKKYAQAGERLFGSVWSNA